MRFILVRSGGRGGGGKRTERKLHADLLPRYVIGRSSGAVCCWIDLQKREGGGEREGRGGARPAAAALPRGTTKLRTVSS